MLGELCHAEAEIKEFLLDYQVVDTCEINEDSIGITFEWLGMPDDEYAEFEYNHEMMDNIKHFISNLNLVTAGISDEISSEPYFDLYVPF